jgi:hypothetical protein
MALSWLEIYKKQKNEQVLQCVCVCVYVCVCVCVCVCLITWGFFQRYLCISLPLFTDPISRVVNLGILRIFL